MADEPAPACVWRVEQLRSGDLPNKYLINFLQDNPVQSILNEHRLPAYIKNEHIVDATTSCLSAKCLKPQRRRKLSKFDNNKEAKAEVLDEGLPSLPNKCQRKVTRQPSPKKLTR
ncbi:peptidyl-prolyl cis-trans isomerase FKBP3-like [Stigmatopora nigra]